MKSKLEIMSPEAVVYKAKQILEDAGLEDSQLAESNFLDYADLVKDVVANWPNQKRLDKKRWLVPFMRGLQAMRDDFAYIVERDPMCIYKPAHHVSMEFHKSRAKVRYFYGGNRISKTQAGGAEIYWTLTRSHPYWPLPPIASSCFIIGTNFSKYAPNVFEKKYIRGEAGNPLSPIFPENGKWLHKYDDRKHIITIACRDCADDGRAKQCSHLKGTLTLFSDVEGPGVLAGGQYARGQLDEQIAYDFYPESMERLKTVPFSGLVVSETPIFGKSWWTYTLLKRKGDGPKEENSYTLQSGETVPWVSLHTIDQYSAGLTPKEEIDASKQTMQPHEVAARIYGEHVASTEHAVFDLTELGVMLDECLEPLRGQLFLTIPAGLGDEKDEIVESDSEPSRMAMQLIDDWRHACRVMWREEDGGPFRIWEKPQPLGQYVIGVDVAKGLTKGDYSCGDVYKMQPVGLDIHLEQVAQYHGHVNPRFYGNDLYKLGKYYNEAWLIIERNGPGDATIQRVKETGYGRIYQDVNDIAAQKDIADPVYGVDTNQASKPIIVSLLQSVIKDRQTGQRTIKIRCKESIEEMQYFIQRPSESGKTFQFEAMGSFKDDRVIGAALAVYSTKSGYGLYDYSLAKRRAKEREFEGKDEHTKKFWTQIRKKMKKAASRRHL